jgi:triphosphoribosyl-dephospho-CoA synthase
VKLPSCEEIAWAAQLACLFEVGADKPGNVSRNAGFEDARFEDFVASAVAIGPAFRKAGERTVGETTLAAVTATRRLVATNTNLGMVLLLAPLAKAASTAGGDGLRAELSHVLAALTVEDARLAYEAIRMASPGGLGRVGRHGVENDTVEVTLLDAMQAARDRDAVAREYVTDFEITFGLGHPTLRRLWNEGWAASDAILATFLRILAEVPDTLIARKLGLGAAQEVSGRAARILEAGDFRGERGRAEVTRLGADLRDPGHRLNPGTTADLVAASLFVFLIQGGVPASVSDLTARW